MFQLCKAAGFDFSSMFRDGLCNYILFRLRVYFGAMYISKFRFVRDSVINETLNYEVVYVATDMKLKLTAHLFSHTQEV